MKDSSKQTTSTYGPIYEIDAKRWLFLEISSENISLHAWQANNTNSSDNQARQWITIQFPENELIIWDPKEKQAYQYFLDQDKIYRYSLVKANVTPSQLLPEHRNQLNHYLSLSNSFMTNEQFIWQRNLEQFATQEQNWLFGHLKDFSQLDDTLLSLITFSLDEKPPLLPDQSDSDDWQEQRQQKFDYSSLPKCSVDVTDKLDWQIDTLITTYFLDFKEDTETKQEYLGLLLFILGNFLQIEMPRQELITPICNESLKKIISLKQHFPNTDTENITDDQIATYIIERISQEYLRVSEHDPNQPQPFNNPETILLALKIYNQISQTDISIEKLFSPESLITILSELYQKRPLPSPNTTALCWYAIEHNQNLEQIVKKILVKHLYPEITPNEIESLITVNIQNLDLRSPLLVNYPLFLALIDEQFAINIFQSGQLLEKFNETQISWIARIHSNFAMLILTESIVNLDVKQLLSVALAHSDFAVALLEPEFLNVLYGLKQFSQHDDSKNSKSRIVMLAEIHPEFSKKLLNKTNILQLLLITNEITQIAKIRPDFASGILSHPILLEKMSINSLIEIAISHTTSNFAFELLELEKPAFLKILNGNLLIKIATAFKDFVPKLFAKPDTFAKLNSGQINAIAGEIPNFVEQLLESPDAIASMGSQLQQDHDNTLDFTIDFLKRYNYLNTLTEQQLKTLITTRPNCFNSLLNDPASLEELSGTQIGKLFKIDKNFQATLLARPNILTAFSDRKFANIITTYPDFINVLFANPQILAILNIQQYIAKRTTR